MIYGKAAGLERMPEWYLWREQIPVIIISHI